MDQLTVIRFSEWGCSDCRLKETCLGKAETRERVYLRERVRKALVRRYETTRDLSTRE